MDSRLRTAIAGLLVGVLLGAGSVVGVHLWRVAPALPEACEGQLGPARGELKLLADHDLLARAWSAVSDPDADPRPDGEFDGSRPVVQRSCLLYAGRLGDGPPSVTYLDSTVSGYTNLLRVVEVQVPELGPPTFAVAWHPMMFGSELRFGVVLPLSGTYLAPPDATGVRVFQPADEFAGTPARLVGVAAFDLGVVPDRSPNSTGQQGDIPAVLLVDRGPNSLESGRQAVAIPSLVRDGRALPVRRPLGLWIGGAAEADEDGVRMVARALPQLSADPAFGTVFDHAPARPALTVGIADGGATITFDPDGRGPEPALSYPVPV